MEFIPVAIAMFWVIISMIAGPATPPPTPPETPPAQQEQPITVDDAQIQTR